MVNITNDAAVISATVEHRRSSPAPGWVTTRVFSDETAICSIYVRSKNLLYQNTNRYYSTDNVHTRRSLKKN